MSRIINCQKLHKQAEGLAYQPYPGELGKRIYENICKEAWELWLKRQTMFVNEYRLNLSELAARQMLAKEMENFLFGNGDNLPGGYVPET